MVNLVNLTSKSDIIGAITSTLCFLHCLATPLLFVTQAGLTVGEESHPWWWGTLDIVFLGISFFAVYWSTKKSSKRWIKPVFWGFWAILAGIILNEKFELLHLPEALIYVPTLGLIVLHFYNRRYCHCENERCCAD